MKNLKVVLGLALGLTLVTSCTKEDVTPGCSPDSTQVTVDTTTTGSHTEVFTNVGGCDSIVTFIYNDTTTGGGGCTQLYDVEMVPTNTVATPAFFNMEYTGGGVVTDVTDHPDFFNSTNIVNPYAADLFVLDFKEENIPNMSEYTNVSIGFITAKDNNVVITNLKVTVTFENGSTADIPLTYVSGNQTFATGLSGITDFQVSWTQTGSGELNVWNFSINGDICQ